VRKDGFHLRAWRATHKRLELPELSEDFDELFGVIARDGDFSILPWPATERKGLEARFHNLDWLS
jgi:hypothetical protein